MNLKAQAKAALCFGAILALSFCPTAQATDVALGSDYFQTQSGTQFTFGSYGLVSLMGVPIGPGLTDTIVQRQGDAILAPGATAQIPIQMVGLSLESTAPLNINGSFFDIFVTLDPADLTEDTGQMTISENSTGTGGTFISSLDVFFDVCLAPGAGGVGCAPGTSPVATGELELSNSGANWSNTPSPGSILVVGPFGDQSANTHTGLPSNYEDFYLQGTLTESESGGTHVVDPASSPEPSSLALWATGLLLAGLLGKKVFTAA